MPAIDTPQRALRDAAPSCFWLDRPERPEAAPPLEGDLEVDLAVLGGGFTGLWAALLAARAEPGREIAVLEGERVAEGASGRNGGFADASLTHGPSNGLHHFPDEAELLQALGRENFAELLADLERHGIDARYEGSGKLEVATAPHWVPELREHLAALERLGEPARWLGRDAVRAELASPTYEAGCFNARGGVVDPARLCWGLARAARERGVRIFERTRVSRIRRRGAGVELRAPGGRVRARRALVATNAFRSPLRPMRRAVIPIWDYALVSEPLTPGQRSAIGWKQRQGVGDTGNRFHYYRLTDDDRILWGGYDAIYHFGGRTDAACQQRAASFELLSRHFFETFPQLAGLRFSHRWGGPIATTTRFCLDSGRALGGRVSWAGGYTGLGVGASRFGARAALAWLDEPESRLLRLRMVRKRPLPWPPEPLRSLVVQITRFELARADRRQGRRGAWLRLLDRLGIGFDS